MIKVVASAFTAKIDNTAVNGPQFFLGKPGLGQIWWSLGRPTKREKWLHFDYKNHLKTVFTSNKSPFFDLGPTLWGFWLNFDVFEGPRHSPGDQYMLQICGSSASILGSLRVPDSPGDHFYFFTVPSLSALSPPFLPRHLRTLHFHTNPTPSPNQGTASKAHAARQSSTVPSEGSAQWRRSHLNNL